MKNSSMHEHAHVHDHEIKEDDVLKEMMACDDDHPNLNWDGDVVGELDREMWFERDQDEDLLINYDDFPPLPDFPTISSSSSSSCSNNLNPQAIKNSSSSNTTSSSSASSSSVTYAHDPALLSTGSGIPPAESGVGRLGSADYMDVMEELGGMDLLDSDDIWDPSTLFPCDGLDDIGFGKQEERIATDSNSQQEEKTTPSEDLAVLFFEWLKSNKESISAEDLRSIKLKRSTIECAAKRLGGGKEGMKQLLKLILEWVQNHQLQRKRIKERENSNSLFHQSNPNLNPNHNPGTDPYFLPPMPQQWIPQQPYNVPESTTIYPPMMYPYMGEAVYNPLPNQTLVHQSSWPPPSQHYAAFPEQNLAPTPPPSHVVPPSYAPFPNSYPCQVYPSPTDRLVRLGSSATKEARKKRMARQKRFFSHGRNHNHHNQHVIETRLANDANCTSTSQNPNWLYWPSSPSTSVSPSTMIVSEPPPPPMLQGDRQTLQSNDYQRQGSLDKRQGCKIGTEKNLKFLLQKVLKQSDVGSLGRIVLPKKEAETYLPGLEARDGISLAMEELGSSRIWNMRYRFWPNNKSRMYLLENTGEFVRSNGLQEGDFIVIYSDVKCGKYLIRGIKVRQSGSKTEAKRQGKMHRNFHANSSAALGSASTSSKEMVR